MSQDEIIRAIQRLGGENLTTQEIRTKYYEIHYSHLDNDHSPIAISLKQKLHRSKDARSYNQALKSVVANGLVIRTLVLTHSANYKTCTRFMYSLTSK